MYRGYTQAPFVRAHTMCTPFLMHTYAFAYDVHDVFSVHVCHTDILLCDDCTFFPFIFQFFWRVYKQYTQLSSIVALQLLEFHWNTTYNGTMLPGWWTKNIYISSGSMEIITWMFIKDIQGSLYLSLHLYAMIVIENYMFCTVNNLF